MEANTGTLTAQNLQGLTKDGDWANERDVIQVADIEA
jgi:hypothetical protein